MKFSYTDVWNDTVELLRGNAAIVIALVGVFIFLPLLVMSQFLPPPTPQEVNQIVDQWREYFSANWHWLLLARLVAMVGEISLLMLFLDARGRKVGALIAAAVLILPFYFLATVVVALMIGIGIVLLIVPGLYLIGRLLLVSPEVVAAEQRNPITAISRSFELTKGNGWAVLGLFLLVWIAGSIIALVAGMLLGIIFLAVAGDDIGGLLTNIVKALTSAAVEVVVIALVAALYRRLAGPASAAK